MNSRQQQDRFDAFIGEFTSADPVRKRLPRRLGRRERAIDQAVTVTDGSDQFLSDPGRPVRYPEGSGREVLYEALNETGCILLWKIIAVGNLVFKSRSSVLGL
jgi:hypothetical protein